MHAAEVFYTLEQYLEGWSGARYARRRWKRHVERNGNIPLVTKCSICSGAELRRDIKRGKWKVGQASKETRRAEIEQ